MDTTWRDAATCIDTDTEFFFPAGVTGAALDQAERAKAVCASCPVREQCLDWALATGQDPGIWGGLTEDERRQRRRKLAQQARQQRLAKSAPGGTR
jgi:WhiB family transcriptional regulator, redox-sensing transcriptional regulator